MSDMSRPGPLPTADHERHDALLVAQLAAGDPLAVERRDEAQRLVGGCPACAALAADLRVVSAAVAQEPVPPRRRDFRLSPEQAEQLSGNALTRFLRRLSLPNARAFQPAAAGVLAIGLIFVVAGFAWPDGASITVQAEPNFVTYDEPVPASPSSESPAAQSMVEQGPEDAFGGDEAEGLPADLEFFEALPEHQAGTSERAAQKSVASEVAPSEADGLEPDAAELAAPAASAASAADGGLASDAALEAEAHDDLALEAAATVDAIIEEPADEAALASTAPALAPDAAKAGEGTMAASDTDALVDDSSSGELLIFLGLLLALGGGGLLLVGWLARRSRDPLLR